VLCFYSLNYLYIITKSESRVTFWHGSFNFQAILSFQWQLKNGWHFSAVLMATVKIAKLLSFLWFRKAAAARTRSLVAVRIERFRHRGQEEKAVDAQVQNSKRCPEASF
jgi:hypothetical protein